MINLERIDIPAFNIMNTPRENCNTQSGWLRRLVLILRQRRIRKTKEAIAYWGAAANLWRQMLRSEHSDYERMKVVEAHANYMKHKARLSCLEDQNNPGEPGR